MSENWQTALYRIAQATRSGTLKWRRDESPFEGSQNISTRWKYKTFGTEDAMQLYTVDYVESDGDSNVHKSKTVLEFIDNEGNSEWQFPEHEAVADILSAIQYQISDIDSKLRRISKLK